ncbi:tetratricopeptide repeat protein [Streptomyces sp. NRRL F-5135]|uniref:tetratricopeptide repeat protein n=1 Tax=Streptomyces sp. NRRL F-5135 TaxID=1463858 RepID=UPI003B63CA62
MTDSAGHGDGRTAPADGPGRAGTGSRTGSDGTDRDPDLSEPAPGGLGSAGADLPSASGGPGRAPDFAGPAGAGSGDPGPRPDSAEAAGGTADEGAPAGDGFPAEASADGSAAAAADAGPPERTAGEGPAGGRRRAADGESGRPRRRPPAGSRPFFGRERELKALHGDIERAGLNTLSGRKEPRARVLLIAGRPGSGRTALADELAARLAHAYPDGVVRARLTEAGGEAVPTERTAREILTFFALPTPPGAGEDELCERVRAALAARRVLLLLDDAGDAGQVDPLVPDNPDCLVVAVATGPLTGIPDVRPCTIGGMDTKAAIALLERFAGEVRITVDPQAAESLAEECAGQPAALVLAGGWLAARPTTSVADAAKRLRAQPQSQDSPVGDRPLARAFRLVYESLPPSSARFLRLLALAPAGRVDAHTASALAGCSVSDAMVLLKDLAALGLLRASGVRAAAHHGAHDDQYLVPGALMPTLRALLEEKDRPAEMQLARARMLERTVRLLQSCRSVTEPEGSPARAKLATLPRTLRFPHAAAAEAWLGAHLPALLASARLAVADGELDTLARRLIAALVRALTAHHGAEAAAPELYGLHRLVLDIAERRELHRERAAALLNLGDLDARTGRTRDALARYRAALDAGRAANDLYATGRAMESVGGAHQDLQDWQRAADWYGRALSQRLSRGERADAARLYGRLGTVHTYAGRYGEALRDWRAATAEYRRIHDLPGQARALSEVARVQEYAGRPHESLRTCEEAIGWARQAGDDRLQAALRLRAADTLDRLGDSTAARLHRSAAERLLEGATAESGTRGT